MKRYNERGDEFCNPPAGHEFRDGLCVHCEAPQTPAYTDAAIKRSYEEEDGRLLGHEASDRTEQGKQGCQSGKNRLQGDWWATGAIRGMDEDGNEG